MRSFSTALLLASGVVVLGCRIGYEELAPMGAGGASVGGAGGAGGAPEAGQADGGAAGVAIDAEVMADHALDTVGGSGGVGGAGPVTGDARAGAAGSGGGAGSGAAGAGGRGGGSAGADASSVPDAGTGLDASAGGGGASGAGGTGGNAGTAGSGGNIDAGGQDAPGTPPDVTLCSAQTFGGHSYLLCSEPRNWFDAHSACLAIGMHLVRVDDAGENDWLHANPSLPMTGRLWFGGSDNVVEGEWRWTDGTQFWQGGAAGAPVNGSFTAWTRRQPDNYAGTEHCLELDLSGPAPDWNDGDCALSAGFVCELP